EDRCRRARAALGIDPEQALIVAIGRQEWQKGHDVLLAAVPELLRAEPGAVVAIAGRAGGQTERLRETITRENLSDHVRLLGFRDDAPELLSAADVFAFPSRWEGLPGTVLEAMALEAPIVATDLPMTREVVTREDAMLVPPDDAAALAAAIVDCLHDRAAAQHRARAARRRVAHEFTIEQSALGMLRFFERALGSSG
ncbi:MAG TPA: glycosyltransferase family 4 protein, partial [Acidimicrobiia bacterium]|nr:glycosyltransferase family 4 protein [Acidimicrobiia bacterium]